MGRRLGARLPLSLAALMLALVGCSGDEEPDAKTVVDAQWYDALDSAIEKAGGVGPIPEPESGECPLGTPQIAGEEVGGDPLVGVSAVDDSRSRLGCEWSQPATNLVVVRFEDSTTLESARQEVSVMGEQDLGVTVQTTEEITVDEHEFIVRRAVFPTDDSHIDYSVWFFDEARPGMVILDVATTKDRGLIKSYTSQQAAEDLAALLP